MCARRRMAHGTCAARPRLGGFIHPPGMIWLSRFDSCIPLCRSAAGNWPYPILEDYEDSGSSTYFLQPTGAPTVGFHTPDSAESGVCPRGFRWPDRLLPVQPVWSFS
jgi:hypothetical protein